MAHGFKEEEGRREKLEHKAEENVVVIPHHAAGWPVHEKGGPLDPHEA
jgi:hypothetical protein